MQLFFFKEKTNPDHVTQKQEEAQCLYVETFLVTNLDQYTFSTIAQLVASVELKEHILCSCK